MKKIIVLIITVLAISVLSGCMDNKTVDVKNSTNSTAGTNVNSKIEGGNVSNDYVGNLNLTDEIDKSTGNSKGTSTGTGNAGSEWCVPGSKIKVKLPGGEKEYTVTGITTYKGIEVCRAERDYENGKSSYYYSKDDKFQAMNSNATGPGAYSEAMSNVTSTS